MRNPGLSFVSTVAAVAIVAAAATAIAAHLTGTWLMEATVPLPDEQEPCVYMGTCSLNQSGGDLSGTVDLALDSGPPGCPAEMSATLTGTAVEGAATQVSGTLSGQLGQLVFDGTISPNPGGSGSVIATQGPFSGAEGTWTAEQQALLAIPTVTTIGAVLLAALLLLAAARALRRRPA